MKGQHPCWPCGYLSAANLKQATKRRIVIERRSARIVGNAHLLPLIAECSLNLAVLFARRMLRRETHDKRPQIAERRL